MIFNFWSSWVLGLQEYSTMTFYFTLVVKPRASSLGGMVCINWNEDILYVYWIVILLLYVYHFPPPTVLLSILLILSFTYIDFKMLMKSTFSVFSFFCSCLYFCDWVRKSFQNTIMKLSSCFSFFWSLMVLNFKLRFLIHFKFSCTWYEAIGSFVYEYPII